MHTGPWTTLHGSLTMVNFSSSVAFSPISKELKSARVFEFNTIISGDDELKVVILRKPRRALLSNDLSVSY